MAVDPGSNCGLEQLQGVMRRRRERATAEATGAANVAVNFNAMALSGGFIRPGGLGGGSGVRPPGGSRRPPGGAISAQELDEAFHYTMTSTDIKDRWDKTYRQLVEEADAFRNSQAVAFGLLDVYDTLSAVEKQYVHSVLAEWMISDDNRLRYDAEFLTSQRNICSMKPAVERAIAKLENCCGPEPLYEVKKLRRILDELDSN